MSGIDGVDQLPIPNPNSKVIRNTFGRTTGNQN
jgi:hypothetical protein